MEFEGGAPYSEYSKTLKPSSSPPPKPISTNGSGSSGGAKVSFSVHAASSTKNSSIYNNSLHSINTSDTTLTGAVSLHDNLMLAKKKDPYKYYEVIKIMGGGSMGSVAKVKKKKSAMGGSARKAYVTEESKSKGLLGLVSCLKINFCLPKQKKDGTLSMDEEPTKNNGMFMDDPSTTTLLSSVTKSNNSGTDLSIVSGITLDRDITTSDDSSRNNNKKNKRSTMVGYDCNYKVVYALKSIVMDRVSDPIFIQELQNEIKILQTLDHPNICKAIETYEFKSRMYLVLELCQGGDLYSRDPYDEHQAKYIVRSILDACSYLHRKNITHRDLKYENIMFASPTSPNVKIIDFGLSKKYGPDEIMKQTVGTVYTMAPEVIIGNGYDQLCDVWSAGVLAFMLCSSSLPFYGKSRKVVVEKVLKGTFGFKGRRWNDISDEAKDFITTLLVHDLEDRPTCVEALDHKWFHTDSMNHPGKRVTIHRDGSMGQIVSSVVMDRVQATIQMFATYTSLKKLALYVIAHKSTVDEIGFLHQLFQNRFDTEKDGVITFEEFKAALSVYDYTEDELSQIFTACDIDGCSNIGYSEFLAATIEAHGTIEEERIAEAFDRIDSNDSGFITVANLKDFLGDEISEEFIENVIDEVDVSNDGRVDYAEFMAMWDGSFDDDLQRTLQSVGNKRMLSESAKDFGPIEDLFDDKIMASRDDGGNTATENLELSGFGCFNEEKEKSMRGAWI